MVSFADKPLVEPASVEHWERWILEHGTADGARLKLRKKNAEVPGITYDEALEVALCHGWIDGQAATFDADYSLRAFTPRRPRGPWSQRNVEIVARLIAEGRMREGGFAEIERAKSDGRWDAAYRQSTAPVPDDLRTALDASPAASAFFDGLSAQNRWAVLFRIEQAKRPATRERRIADFVAMLARGETFH